MIIHNRLEIKKGDKVYVSHNTLLAPALKALREFKPYSTKLAVGLGSGETEVGQEKLENWQVTLGLVTESFNFDPMNGVLFLTKRLVLGSEDLTALELVEVGLTGSGGTNPWVANRFLVNAGEPIYRDPGEEFSLTITLYLQEGENGKMKLTGGSNPLVKLLLGDGIKGENPNFEIARGYNLTDTNTKVLVDYASVQGASGVTATPEFDSTSGALTISLEGSLGVGVVEEFLLCLDEQVVARSNVSEMSGVVSGIEENYVADADNMVTIDRFGVKSITKVVDIETGEETTAFTTKNYGTSFMGGLKDVFVDKSFDASVRRIVSKHGDKVAFLVDGKLEIYNFSSGEPVKLGSSNIDASNAKWVLMFNDMLFIKTYSPDGVWGMRYYLFNSEEYIERFYRLAMGVAYENVDAESPWKSMDMVQMSKGDDTIYSILAVSSDPWIFNYKAYLYGVELYNGGYFYSNYYEHGIVRGMMPSNRMDYQLMFHDAKTDKVFRNNYNKYVEVTNSKAKSIMNDYQDAGWPRLAKNFAFAVDGATSTLKYVSIEDMTDGEVVFSGAKKVVIDQNLEYLACIYDDIIRVYYLDGSLHFYEFFGGLGVSEEVEDAEFVGDCLIVFFKSGKIQYATINKNKFILAGLEKGKSFAVTYSADNTPGAGGENVKANVKISVLAS